MTGVLAVALYRCEVAGELTESVDIQVRYFESGDMDVESYLKGERTETYKNDQGETVVWPFVKLLAVEDFSPQGDGKEVVGFIAGCHEFAKWVGMGE